MNDLYPGIGRREHVLALVFFAILTVWFHGLQDLLHTLVGAGDAYMATIASLLFTTKLSPWNPYVQLGQYSFANIHFQSFYPPNLILLTLFPNTLGYNLFILVHYVAAGYFFFLFARRFMYTWPALFGGMAFMLGGFMGAHKGHASMLSASVWLPLILYFADRYSSTRRFREAAAAGVSVGACIVAGFPQITLYTCILVACYLGLRLFAPRWHGERGVKQVLTAGGLIFGIGLLIGSIQLMPPVQAFPSITRQKLTYDLFTQDSLPPMHILALFIPNVLGGFFGIPSYSTNFNVVEVHPYSGIVPLAFAYVAVFAYWRRNRDVVFWTAVGLGALVLALGSLTPIYRVLYYVPVYNLFRASARHLYEVDFALAVLAAFGMNHLFTRAELTRRQFGRIRRATVAFSLCFAVALGSALCLHYVAGLLLREPQRLEGIRINPHQTLHTTSTLILRNLDPAGPTILIPVVCFVLLLVIIILTRTRFRRVVVLAALPIAAADVYINYRTLYAKPDTRDLFNEKARPEMMFLNQQGFNRDLYRTFPVDSIVHQAYPLLNMMYGVSVINDYTPFWMKRYRAFTDFAFNGAMPPHRLQDRNILAITGAKYLMATSTAVQKWIESVEDTRAPAGIGPLSDVTVPRFPTGWQSLGPSSMSGTVAYLKTPVQGAIPLLQTRIPLVRNSTYLLQFEARTGDTQTPLIVDLYSGPGYDSPEQDRVLHTLGREFRRFTVTIPSGANAPDHAFLRLYTIGESSIELRNLDVRMSMNRAMVKPAYSSIFTTKDGMKIYHNPAALPRFRFVSRIVPGTDLDQVRALVSDPAFDIRNTAVVEGVGSEMNVSPGQLRSYRLDNNVLEWTVHTDDKSFFVVGDTYFPGWSAYVDGREVPIYAVNGIVRGIFIEGAGQHSVSMRFRPWSLYAGLIMTAAGLCLAFCIWWRDRVSLRTADIAVHS